MCFTVPSSWSILNQKTGRVKGDPLVIVKLKIKSIIKVGIVGITIII